jgi:hypothetical protein
MKKDQNTETIKQTLPSNFSNTLLNEIATIKTYAKELARHNFFYDTRSDQIDKITKALTEFMAAMPRMTTDKNAMGRYKYQSLPSMRDEINPVLAKFGLKCMQPPHTIGETTYIVTKIVHTSGQYFRAVTSIPKEYTMAGKTVRTDQNLQAMGGAQTYIKRYALKSILCIDADEDTDGGVNTSSGATYQQRKTY